MPFVQQRRGTAVELQTANELPLAGQIYFESDTNKVKIGDGSRRYNDLPYLADSVTIADLDGLQETLDANAAAAAAAQSTADTAATESSSAVSLATTASTTAASAANIAQLTRDQLGAAFLDLASSVGNSVDAVEQNVTVNSQNIASNAVNIAALDTSLSGLSTAFGSHAGRHHYQTGNDPLSAADIGAATQADLNTESGRISANALQIALNSGAITQTYNDLSGTISNLTTSNITEGSNLYFSDARTLDAVNNASAVQVGGSTSTAGKLNLYNTSGYGFYVDQSYGVCIKMDVATASPLQVWSKTQGQGILFQITTTGGTIQQGDIETLADIKAANLTDGTTTRSMTDVLSPPWANIQNKPTTFTASAHASTHATGGSDAITPASIGAQPAGTYATLVNGTVPSAQLPSYVDDVIEGTLATFPTTGDTGKIYVDTGTNKTYRWGGSTYVEIASSPGSTDAVPEGSTNLYFTDARVLGLVGTTVQTICAGDDARLSDARTPTAHTHSISDVTSLQGALNLKADSSSLATVATSGSYTDLSNVPSTFPPSSHTHPQSDITNLATDLAAKADLAGATFTGDVEMSGSVLVLDGHRNVLTFSGDTTTGLGWLTTGEVALSCSNNDVAVFRPAFISSNVKHNFYKGESHQTFGSSGGTDYCVSLDAYLDNTSNDVEYARATISDYAGHWQPSSSVIGYLAESSVWHSNARRAQVVGFKADNSLDNNGFFCCGFYSTVSSGGVSNRYQLYASGDAPSFFGGQVGIGIASGFTEKLHVNGDVRFTNITDGTTTRTIAEVMSPPWGYITGKPTTFAPSTHTHAISDLTQSSATSGQVITWDGTAWVAATPSSGGSTNIAGLTDVTVSSPATGQYLRYVSLTQNWVNSEIALGDVGASGASLGQVARFWNGSWGPSTLYLSTAQDVSSITPTDGQVLTYDAAAAVWRGEDIAWGSITGIPSTFAPSAHTHAISDITNLQTELNGKVESDTTQAGGGTAVTNIVVMSQADYNNLVSPDSNTVYFLT